MNKVLSSSNKQNTQDASQDRHPKRAWLIIDSPETGRETKRSLIGFVVL
jgi:hypothetical protein